MPFLIRWIVSSVMVFLLAYLLPGVEVKDFIDALVVALVLSLLNVFVRPVLIFLTIPATIVTLGLFLFVINAAMIWLTHLIVDGFTVANFWWALLFSVLLSILNSLVMGDNQNPNRRRNSSSNQ